MEADQSRKPEAKSGASVDNSLFSGSHSRSLVSTTPDCLTAEGEEEDHLARLTLRMAQSFLVDEEDESDAEPMLYAWPSWKTDSPDGLSLVSSRAFYTAEPKQQLQEDSNWPALTDAKRQATRLRLNNNPEAYVDLCGRGLPGHHWNAFPPVCAPYGCMRVGTIPPAVQQLRAAQFHCMKQQFHSLKQQHNRTGGGGVSSSAWPPLHSRQRQQQRPKIGSWHGAGALLLNSSAGTGVFIPRTAGSVTETPPTRSNRAAAAVLPGITSELSDQRLRHLLANRPWTKSHQLQLPHEWTY